MLAELRKHLPHAPVIYAADLAGLPYGEKSEAQIAARVAGLLGRLAERYQPRLACIACNTASTIALGMVREVLEIPIVGTVPAIKPAAAITETGVIGLLGTAATIRQAYVDNLEAEFASDKILLRHAAPGLVSAAETKLQGETFDSEVIRNSIKALRNMPGGERMDTLVLACTHFPLLKAELQTELGDEVRLVDGSNGIAQRIVSLTDNQEFDPNTPSRFVQTGKSNISSQLATHLRSYGIEHIHSF